VLDALKGIVHQDDRQVRSIRVVCLPQDDVLQARGSLAVHLRLDRGEEFLINVYEGIRIEVPIVERPGRAGRERGRAPVTILASGCGERRAGVLRS
jgi:hypothetical protein